MTRAICNIFGWAACLACFFCSSVVPAKSTNETASIGVVYPTEKDIVQAPATFLVGAILPGHSLTCNGQKVRVNDNGFFAHGVPVHHGVNHFTLALDDGSVTRQVNVNR